MATEPTSFSLYYPLPFPLSDDDKGEWLQLDVLNLTNYTMWAYGIYLFLRAACVDDIIHTSDADLPSIWYDRPTTEREAIALRAIRTAMGQEYQAKYPLSTGMTAKQLWDTIRETERARRDPIELRQKLLSTKLKHHENFPHYFSSLLSTIQDIEFALGTGSETWKMGEDEIVFYMLNGLPRSWDLFVAVLREQDLIKGTGVCRSSEELFSELWDYELRLENRRMMGQM